MSRINLEQMIRSIVQDEIEKTFSFSGREENATDNENATENDEENTTDVDDEEGITLPKLERTSAQSRGKSKNRGRGRVTKSTDGRLRANKK